MTASNSNTPSGDLVYVVQTTKHGPIKIGLTSNIDRRISELQTGSPLPVLLVAWFPCKGREEAAALERKLHRELSKHRMSGEWFGGGAIPRLMELSDGMILNGTHKKVAITPPTPHAKIRTKLKSNNRFFKYKKKWCGDELFDASDVLFHTIVRHDHKRFVFHEKNPEKTAMITAKIEADGLHKVNEYSLISLTKFYYSVTNPNIWHHSSVSEANNAVISWGYKSEYLVLEFVDNYRIIAAFNILDTNVEGVALHHQSAALYQKIAKGTRSFKNKARGVECKKAA